MLILWLLLTICPCRYSPKDLFETSSQFLCILSLTQPYHQKEPAVVRVVEGPLFSEVVAQYQHFQQNIRIHNVPGKKKKKKKTPHGNVECCHLNDSSII